MKLIKKIAAVFLFFCHAAVYGQVNLDSIKNTLVNHKLSPVMKAGLFNQLSTYYMADSTNLALDYANQAYLIALDKKDKTIQAASLLRLSEGYLYNDIYDHAIQYGLEALDLCKALKNDSLLAEAYMNLGWVFYDTENSEFAFQYHQQANELFAKLGNDYKTGYTYNALGLVAQLKGQPETAKVYFEKELQISKLNSNNAPLMPKALNNLGICENNLKNFHSALVFFEEARRLKMGKSSVLFMAETLNQMAYTYFNLKDYNKAEALLMEAKDYIYQSSSNAKKEKLLDNLFIFSQLYKATGRYDKAFLSLSDYNKLKDEMLTRSKSEAVASLKMKKEYNEKEQEIHRLEVQEELRSYQRNALGIGLLLLIIIGVLFFSRLRQKQKKENELAEMKQALTQQELENTQLEKQALDSKLEYKNSELKNSALYVSQKNELIREFVQELKDIYSEMAPQQKNDRFNQLLNKFNYNLEINKEAQEFNQSVEENHRDFLYNLLKAYPTLTENERRLCAQIRLNLSIKDIASLNNISVKSAEMARYRLRKQFNLEPNQGLSEFLKQF